MNKALGAITVLTAEVDPTEGTMDENPGEEEDMTATSLVKKEMNHPTPAAAQIAPTAEIAETADALEVADAPTAETTMGAIEPPEMYSD